MEKKWLLISNLLNSFQNQFRFYRRIDENSRAKTGQLFNRSGILFKKRGKKLLFFSFICILLVSDFSFAKGSNKNNDPFSLNPKIMIVYQGQIDFIQNQFDLVLDIEGKGSADIKIMGTLEKGYQFFLDTRHLKTQLFDILMKLEGSLKYKSGDFYGKVRSQYTLIDYKPIEELSGLFEIRSKRFYLSSLSVGNITCKGYVDFEAPHKLDLIFDLSDIAMDSFLKFWMRGKKMESEGDVSGTIKVSGSLQRPILKGNLTSFNGRVKKLKYDSIYLNAEGVYPHLQIANSILSETDGLSFLLEGSINLKDQAHFKQQIKDLTMAPLVTDSASVSEWTIKRVKGEGEAVEIKYFLRKGKEVDASEGVGILGIERRLNF